MNRVFALVTRVMIGSVPFTCSLVQAQTPAASATPAAENSEAARQNQEVLRIWNQQSGSSAVLAPSTEGVTKVEFHGSIKTDVYNNDISSPAGVITSALQNGTFFKAVTQGDLRAISANGNVTYAQGVITNSNDRSVLSRYSSQLTNLQFGHTSADFNWLLGDVAVNFSPLSSGLGLRGLVMSKKLSGITISGHAGVIEDSWEALSGRGALDGLPVRTRYSRDVFGLKVENAFTPSLKAYITAQAFSDRENSVAAGSLAVLPAKTRAFTTGFAYQQGLLNLTGEVASSQFEEKDQTARSGQAFVIDGTYQFDPVRVRAGHHDISSSYVSLSQGAAPGVKESYVGADWTVAAWMTLGSEYRMSNITTPAYTLLAPAATPGLPPALPIVGTSMSNKMWTNRANITFGPDFAGWGLNLQDMRTRVTDALGMESPSYNFTTTLNYSSQTWSGMLSLGRSGVTNTAYPTANSTVDSWQFMLGRQLNDATADTPAHWNGNLNFTTGQQTQRLYNAGTSTRNTNYGLTFAAQRVNSWQFNGSLMYSILTQPNGGPDLKTTGVQLDATYPLPLALRPGAKSLGTFKAYIRDNLRYSGDPNLRTLERVTGIQVNYPW